MDKKNVSDFFSSYKFVFLFSVMFLVCSVAIQELLNLQRSKNQTDTINSENTSRSVITLGDNNTNSSAVNQIADKKRLDNTSYAMFRLAEFDISADNYNAAIDHAFQAKSFTGSDEVAILLLEKILEDPVLAISSCGSKASDEDHELRNKLMDNALVLMTCIKKLYQPL